MIKDIKSLRELSAQELHNELAVLRKGQLDLRLGRSTNQLRDTSMFRKIKAQVARILTFLNERNKAI